MTADDFALWMIGFMVGGFALCIWILLFAWVICAVKKLARKKLF